jgi:hypothetical protein
MYFDKWLNLESNLEYKHFVCDWKSIVPKTRWRKTAPEIFSFKKKIYFKAYCTYIYVYGIFNKKETIFEFRYEATYDSVPFLKSLLQKAIRRQNKLCAVKAMKHLIKLNLVEAVRRLSIIMVEDVEILESFSTLVWMTTVISFWKPPRRCIEWLLGVVHSLCIHPTHCRYCPEKERKILDTLTEISNKRTQIIYSLELRRAYGGLLGDMKMLNYASLYVKKFDPKETKNYLIDWDSIEILSIGEWELSAVDHHVSPIAKFVEKEYPFDLEYIKKLIWDFRSSVNKRRSTPYDSKNREGDFKSFEKRLEQMAYGILMRKFNENLQK